MHINDLFSLKGRVALVTGGARNLGYDMALALAEVGGDVAITSRTLDLARAASDALIRETGQAILPIRCDVTIEDEVEQMFEAVVKRFGKLDVLVNNAGNVVSTRGDRQSRAANSG